MIEEATTFIRVAIVDDHQMFAESLSRLLALENDIEIVGLGASGKEARALIERFEPRVLLIDYSMPDGDGVEVAADIKQRWPETMIVMITGSADDGVLLSAIEAGCSGFLTKDQAACEVASAVRIAAAGEALVSPAQLARLLPQLSRTKKPTGADLTDRERDVLTLFSRGLATKAMAAELFLSVNTIRNYTQSVFVKLGAHSKLEAVSIAVREGIISYPPR